METCKNCGASLSPGMVCCPDCFVRCSDGIEPAPSSVPADARKKKLSAPVIAAICAAGLLAAAAVMYFCGFFGV